MLGGVGMEDRRQFGVAVEAIEGDGGHGGVRMEQVPANKRLDHGDGVGVDAGGDMKHDIARGGGVEHAVDDDTMEMEVRVEGGTEAVDEGYGAEAG
jgi:hypothetical protein